MAFSAGTILKTEGKAVSKWLPGHEKFQPDK